MADQKTTARQGHHDPKVNIALRNFAISISVLNIFGYTLLGFEQPWAWPFIALATGYSLEIVLEMIGSRMEHRPARFAGRGVRGMVEFLYPAHITSLAMNMLLYVNDRLSVMLFGVLVAISGKWILRAPVRGRLRHYMNPSNLGITMILLLFPWGSIAPPYHFTEWVGTTWDWIVPAIIISAGTMLNGMLTGRMWLILGWLSAFVLQAVIRGVLLDTSIPAALGMMTGVAFVLFTNYMITDPGTSPAKPGAQMAFGAGVAAVYGLLTGFGVAYGLFFATTLTCLIRGGFLWSVHFVNKAREQREAETRRAADAAPVSPAPAAQEAVVPA